MDGKNEKNNGNNTVFHSVSKGITSHVYEAEVIIHEERKADI